jgi:hypothetical protein
MTPHVTKYANWIDHKLKQHKTIQLNGKQANKKETFLGDCKFGNDPKMHLHHLHNFFVNYFILY